MRPIPRKLLIHSGTIAGITDVDRWGQETVSNTAELKYIRIEPLKTMIRDKQNNQVQLSAILFFDCNNSRPKEPAFSQDTIITVDNVTYKIKTIEALYDENKLHHYELGLLSSGGGA